MEQNFKKIIQGRKLNRDPVFDMKYLKTKIKFGKC